MTMTGGASEEKDTPATGEDGVQTKSHDQPAEILYGPVSSQTRSHDLVAAPRWMMEDIPAGNDTTDIDDTSDDDDSTFEDP